MQYVLFLVWIISVNTIILRFIHLVKCSNSSFFLLLSSIPLYGYKQSGHLSKAIWVVCSLGAMPDKAAMNIQLCIFACPYISFLSKYQDLEWLNYSKCRFNFISSLFSSFLKINFRITLDLQKNCEDKVLVCLDCYNKNSTD